MKEKIYKITKKIDEFIEPFVKYVVNKPGLFVYYLFIFILLVVNDSDLLLLFMTVIALRASLILDKANKKLTRDSKLWKNMSENFEKESNSN